MLDFKLFYFDFSLSVCSHRKSAKFDEINVLQTYHPPDKDYGHMKIDEPKTPYRLSDGDSVDQLDAELLAEKYAKKHSWFSNVKPTFILSLSFYRLKKVTSESNDSSDSEPEEETDEQRSIIFVADFQTDLLLLFLSVPERRLDFEKKRKAHYNEFEAVRQARKLIEEEDDEDEDNNDVEKNYVPSSDSEAGEDNHMDVDITEKQSTSAGLHKR